MTKNVNLKIAIIVALLAISFYKLYPTYKVNRLTVDQRKELEVRDPAAFKGAIKLGLDLQGGIRLVFQIDKSKLSPDQANDAVSRALEVIGNRVDQFGISEPIIQQQGEDRIIVEMPGFHDIDRAKKLVGSTALLEFNLVREAEDVGPAIDAIDRYLKRTNAPGDSSLDSSSSTVKETAAVDSAKADSGKALDLFGETGKTEDSLSTEEKAAEQYEKELKDDKPFTALLIKAGYDIAVPWKNIPRAQQILNDPAVKEALPKGVKFAWSAEKEGEPGSEYKRIYLLKSTPEITGSYLEDAKPSISQGGMESGQAVVNMTLNGDGARRFSKISGANIDKRLAIVLDGQIYSAPVIRSKIPNGRAEITGMGNYEEARDLSIVLRAGALPAPMDIIEERVVGPSLGRDSITMSLWAFLVGTILIILYVLVIYRLTGFNVLFALVLNIVGLMAILAGMGLTLTLPGIAGIILTMGMAVDGNVLINERIKEELRTGKTVRAAIEAGYKRAFSAIFDSNLTTIITGVILHYYGTGPIKGFAVTLIIGLLVSMFTGIWVTRQVFNKVTTSWNVQKLSI